MTVNNRHSDGLKPTNQHAADRLRAAAQVIRDTAAKATKGICPQWTYEAVRHVARNCDIDCGHAEHYNDPLEKTWDRYDDWSWIALLGPDNGNACTSCTTNALGFANRILRDTE